MNRRCRACGEPVIFARTEKLGWQPLNPLPDDAVGIRSGNVQLPSRQAELPVPPAPPAQCGKQRRLRCSFDEGHEGPHHHRPAGAEWEAKP